jgi:alpha-amylase
MLVNLIFRAHQPVRLREYTIFDIGLNSDYFDRKRTETAFRAACEDVYEPVAKCLLKILKANPGFKASFSLSGTFIGMLESGNKNTLNSFKKLLKHERIEIVSQTFYNSVSILSSRGEFEDQLELNMKKAKSLFGKEPSFMLNTSRVYFNDIPDSAKKAGITGIITHGVEKLPENAEPNFLFKDKKTKSSILFINKILSEDVIKRFRDKRWDEWKINEKKLNSWLASKKGDIVSILIDLEKVACNQENEGNIIKFLTAIAKLGKFRESFVLPSEARKKLKPSRDIDVLFPVLIEDSPEKNNPLGYNTMQQSAVKKIYAIESHVKKSKDKEVLENWRLLLDSEHFSSMAVNDETESPFSKTNKLYESPYEAFIYYMNCLQDIRLRLINNGRKVKKNANSKKKNPKKSKSPKGDRTGEVLPRSRRNSNKKPDRPR